MELTFQDIHKSFGSHEVLNGISFTVHSGRAMGFLGRNGSGKTTSMRCLMDVFKPDKGQFLIDNKPFDVNHHAVGYMPEVRGLYEKEKILDQLIYFGMLRGISRKNAKESSLYWLEKVDLAEYAKKNLDVLSKGNQQKIQIIQALIHNPDILILDEPFSGLDPVNSEILKNIIREQIQLGKLLIFSSHQMNYVEEFCDDIALLDRGKIILSGDLTQIRKSMSDNRYLIKTGDNNALQLKEDLHTAGYETQIQQKDLIVTLKTADDKRELLRFLLDKKVDVDEFASYAPSLNDIFIAKVGEQNE